LNIDRVGRAGRLAGNGVSITCGPFLRGADLHKPAGPPTSGGVSDWNDDAARAMRTESAYADVGVDRQSNDKPTDDSFQAVVLSRPGHNRLETSGRPDGVIAPLAHRIDLPVT